MADFHNFSDLKAMGLLERELRDVRDELCQASGYDPAMSLAENTRMMVQCAILLGSLHRTLRNQYLELKKELENDKAVARTYPIAGVSGVFSNASPKEGEFHPENLLGSTDGYGR
jgi:hypothetical protein